MSAIRKWIPTSSHGGMMEVIGEGGYVLYVDHAAELAALRARVEVAEREVAVLRASTASDHSHKCRACGLNYTPADRNEDCPICGHDGIDAALADAGRVG